MEWYKGLWDGVNGAGLPAHLCSVTLREVCPFGLDWACKVSVCVAAPDSVGGGRRGRCDRALPPQPIPVDGPDLALSLLDVKRERESLRQRVEDAGGVKVCADVFRCECWAAIPLPLIPLPLLVRPARLSLIPH